MFNTGTVLQICLFLIHLTTGQTPGEFEPTMSMTSLVADIKDSCRHNATSTSNTIFILPSDQSQQLHDLVCGVVSESIIGGPQSIVSSLAMESVLGVRPWLTCLDCEAILVAECEPDTHVTWNYVSPKRLLTDVIQNVLVDVLNQLEWTSLIVIYDDMSDVGSQYLDHLSDHLISIHAHQIQPSNMSFSIDSILDHHTTGAINIEQHFLLACSLLCAQLVLQKANVHELTANEQGFLTYKDRWLMLVTEADLPHLQQHLQLITHLTAISIPPSSHLHTEKQVLEEYGDYVVQDYYMEEASPGHFYLALNSSLCTQNETATDTATEPPINKLRSFIYGAMWKPGGRKFEVIGYYANGDLNMNFDLFPNVQYGFNGRVFNVTTNLWGPFVYTEKTNDTVTFHGLTIDILDEMASLLNFTYHISLPSDGMWGNIEDETGQWTGMVAQLVHKEVDIAAAPLAVFPSREDYIDFIQAFHVEYSAFLYRPPPPNNQRIYLIVSPFKWQVWVCLLVAVVVMAICLVFISHLSAVYETRTECLQELGSFDTALWFTYGALVNQGTEIRRPSSQSVRLSVGFWYMAMLIVLATYSGNLIASLVLFKTWEPFTTLEELSLQSEYAYGTIAGTVWHQLLENAQSDVYQRMWASIQANVENGLDVLSTSEARHMEMVHAGSYAYLTDVTVSTLATTEYCYLAVMDETFFPMQYAMAVQNNSAYQSVFSVLTLRFQASGLILKWQDVNWPTSLLACPEEESPRPLTFDDLQGAFVASAFIIATSLLVFLAELSIHHTKMTISKWRERHRTREVEFRQNSASDIERGQPELLRANSEPEDSSTATSNISLDL